MIVKRSGGMTEFIPSPKEKRESLIHDHVLELVALLHDRLCLIEEAFGLPPEATDKCHALLTRIRAEEARTHAVNRQLAATGTVHAGSC